MKHVVALITCLFLSSFAAATKSESATLPSPEGRFSVQSKSQIPDVTGTQRAWITFSSSEGRFSLQFPKEPTPEVKDVDSVLGKLTMYTYTTSSSTVTYMASFSDYPSVPGADRQQPVLDAVRDGIAEKLEARVVEETKISINGNPGREFRMAKTVEGSDLVYHWRAYLVGRRLYQVAAAYYKRDSQSRELPKYFESFQLLSESKG